MSEPVLIGERRPWWHAGQSGGNPFVSLGLEYCTRCRDEVDTDTDAAHRDGTYVYRRRCLRCGMAIKYGAYQAPLVGAGRLPAAAFEWITEPGQDRR